MHRHPKARLPVPSRRTWPFGSALPQFPAKRATHAPHLRPQSREQRTAVTQSPARPYHCHPNRDHPRRGTPSSPWRGACPAGAPGVKRPPAGCSWQPHYRARAYSGNRRNPQPHQPGRSTAHETANFAGVHRAPARACRPHSEPFLQAAKSGGTVRVQPRHQIQEGRSGMRHLPRPEIFLCAAPVELQSRGLLLRAARSFRHGELPIGTTLQIPGEIPTPLRRA